ncbi:Spo11/DNA topoisomerase VI subunit A [Trema orientale]|uniref:Spo11/DNA topoisomerase VI subunit A n=1 Tax=Trema orientale TaxID=63057 RepID=A0A2P5FLP7_TREOI|nr:Spo11/DNA topoisomerase VI subunit A [Trema orientale]
MILLLRYVAAEPIRLFQQFQREGCIAIDCTEVEDNGKEIPYSVSSITDMKNKGAKFILLVEKDTVFLSKGMPDVLTRSFFRRLKVELYLPILGLMD